jgi:uncharacterized membrane protein YbaN (DUF454 family)
MLQVEMMSSIQDKTKPTNPVLRWTLLVSGVLATALGVLGIFLPVLPTVPFLLLALACFARSSERFYVWLLDHAHFGPIIRPYIDGQGMTPASKAKAIALVWASIAISALFLVETRWVQWVLWVVACGVTLYLFNLPGRDVKEFQEDLSEK